MQYEFSADVAFPSEKSAVIACKTLYVENEALGLRCKKYITTTDHVLRIIIQGDDLRALRNSINGTLEQMQLIVRTLEAFS